eukprot:CAMPEP_0119034944 /NCGR_PEP_ID=MMETSP1177-20130426/1954_1 /TAXON_ID=2985 /ORGANISM="Ochromonas sp, Strain CCMP1899" /LENGTH=253 /DNA_ID=CAMNT_0006992783 /DNA_START=249 /DNA_END=1010 /DNA_ORIENTATION=+
MEAGCSIENLGLQVMIGPSLMGAGRGLFLSIAGDVEKVILPAGTPICGYSKGKFTKEADGDKSVAYMFSNPYTGVIFEKTLMPLLDAVGIIDLQIKEKKMSKFKSINKLQKSNISDVILGHKMSSDNDEIEIVPDITYLQRYFIPDEETEDTVWGPGRLGMYANDLAYYDGVTEEEYTNNSPDINILQIVWRMEFTDQVLSPTWPVVITLKDILLTNKEPMEVGLQYGWNYWKSVIELMSLNSDHPELVTIDP